MIIYTFRNYSGNSRAIAEKCLSELLGKSVFVSYYGDGKPYVVGEDLFVSISHTYKDFVFAVSKKPVGIDIEYKKSRHYEGIADRMFGDKEILDIDEFYREWTKYEAKFKHGGEDGKYAFFNVFEDTQMTVFSEDEEYLFIPVESFL